MTREFTELDALCDWMRRRGVVALKIGETALTLGSLQEPVEMKEPIRPSPEEIRAKAREERAELYYNKTPLR